MQPQGAKKAPENHTTDVGPMRSNKKKRGSERAAMAHSALDVLLPSPEIVLEEDIQYTTEPKGWLDDVWGEFTNWGRGKHNTFI